MHERVERKRHKKLVDSCWTFCSIYMCSIIMLLLLSSNIVKLHTREEEERIIAAIDRNKIDDILLGLIMSSWSAINERANRKITRSAIGKMPCDAQSIFILLMGYVISRDLPVFVDIASASVSMRWGKSVLYSYLCVTQYLHYMVYLSPMRCGLASFRHSQIDNWCENNPNKLPARLRLNCLEIMSSRPITYLGYIAAFCYFIVIFFAPRNVHERMAHKHNFILHSYSWL